MENTDGVRQGTLRFYKKPQRQSSLPVQPESLSAVQSLLQSPSPVHPITIDAISHKKHQPDKNGRSAIIEGGWIHNSIIQAAKLLLEVQI